ncbi:hypothetical protein [Isobaculum melis]
MPTMPTLPSIPDIDFQKIADNTYDSDRLNIGDQLNNSNYIILKKLDNPDGNGAQGIAVVSKKDYDKGNFSNIIISYRGTEPSAGDGDINADINQIIFGVSDKVDGMGNPIPTQFDTALNFANEIKNTYNPPNMSVTGHSLGGGLAAYVGAELDIYGKMFSAPNVFRLLSDAAKKRVLNGDTQKKLFNFTNRDDIVGNFGSHDFLIFSKIIVSRKKENRSFISKYLNPAAGHLFPTFEGFDSSGRIMLEVDPDRIVQEANKMNDLAQYQINDLMNFYMTYLDDEEQQVKTIYNEFLSEVDGKGKYDLLTENDIQEVFDDLAQTRKDNKYYFIDYDKTTDLLDHLYQLRVDTYELADKIGRAGEKYRKMDYDLSEIF